MSSDPRAPWLPQPVARDVVVIGADHAGLMCASILAKRGLSVTVVEFLDAVGQRGGSYPYGDYWIEWGHRDARSTGDVADVNYHLGTGLIADLVGITDASATPIRPKMRAHLWPDNKTELFDSFRAFAGTVLGLSGDLLDKFVAAVEELGRTPKEQVAALLDTRFGDWLPTLDDPELREAFLAPLVYSLPPEDRSVGRFIAYNLQQPQELFFADDATFGGQQGLVAPFQRVIRESGGEIALETKVDEILFDESGVRGVRARTPNGFVREYTTSNVIFTELPWHLFDYIDEAAFEPGYGALLSALRPETVPIYGFFLGLNGKPVRRVDGEPDSEFTWNRLMVGNDREYGGGWYLPSLGSRGSAPEGKHLLNALYGGRHGDSVESLNAKLSPLIAYLQEFYVGLADQIEWCEYFHHPEAAVGWAYKTTPRTPVTTAIEGLFLASSASDVTGSYHQVEALAALAATDHVFARLGMEPSKVPNLPDHPRPVTG